MRELLRVGIFRSENLTGSGALTVRGSAIRCVSDGGQQRFEKMEKSRAGRDRRQQRGPGLWMTPVAWERMSQTAWALRASQRGERFMVDHPSSNAADGVIRPLFLTELWRKDLDCRIK